MMSSATVQLCGRHRGAAFPHAAGAGARRRSEMELRDVGHSRRGIVVAGGRVTAVVGALVVQKPFEQVAVDGDRRLVRVLVLAVLDGRHAHALKHRRRAHLPREAVPERRVLVTGSGVEASWRGGVGGGRVRGGGLRREEAGLLGRGHGDGCRGGSGGGGRCGARGGELLAFTAARGGDPGALDVRGAVEAAALAAGAAPVVAAVLLRLVAAVLARGGAGAGGPSAGVQHREGLLEVGEGAGARVRVSARSSGSRRRRLRRRLPELDGVGGRPGGGRLGGGVRICWRSCS